MNAHEVIEDVTNNPFLPTINEERVWDSNADVADIAVHNHIRKAIAKLNFYLRHPLLGEEIDEEHHSHLRSELRRYTNYLNKAHYN